MAQKVLEEEKLPLTVSEIWKIAVTKSYDKQVDSKGKTPWATLGALLYVDVRDNPNSVFLTMKSRPKRFLLKKQADSLAEFDPQKIVIPEIKVPEPKFKEKDLHPLLVYFGNLYLHIFMKTINHNKSDKRGFGEWVHPDIVGCYFPFFDWEKEVVEINNLMGNQAFKLYSFELKRELSLGNIRESFFQAVSNSSWANEGYLVSVMIDENDEFLYELKRLSSAFGIGIIQLNVEDPDSSEILLPAKTREDLDWETINKLASINPDFKEFLNRIRIDMGGREIRNEMYDKVKTKEEIIKNLN